MRLFVIGHFSKGKSTVVAALRKMRQSSTFDERAKRFVDPDYHLTEDGASYYSYCVSGLDTVRLVHVHVHVGL